MEARLPKDQDADDDHQRAVYRPDRLNFRNRLPGGATRSQLLAGFGF